MGNQASMPKGGGGGMIGQGFQALEELEEVIHETYPFLVHSEDSACLVDLRIKDQPLLFVNDLFLQLTLYPREECIGRNCRFLQGKYTNRESVRKVRNAIAQGEGLDVELLNYRKDGRPFWNNFLLLPIWEKKEDKLTGKSPTHFIAIQKDVTFVKPHLTSPLEWTTESLAVFCDSICLPRLAEFVFGADLTGNDFLTITEEQLQLADLPPRELNQAGQLSRFLKETPEKVATFLSACRFSHTNGAALFQSMLEKEKGEEKGGRVSRIPLERVGKRKGRYSGPSGKVANELSAESISFWGVQGNLMESVTIKTLVVSGGKEADEVRDDAVVQILCLTRDFTYQDLQASLFQLLKTTKYHVCCMLKNLDLRIDSPARFDQAQELSNKWRDMVSFKVVVFKKGKFKRLRSKTETQLPEEIRQLELEDEGSPRLDTELDLIGGILKNPSMTVYLIETTYLSSQREDIYDLILKWYINNSQICSLMEKCVDRCISTTRFSDGAILFRSDEGCLSFIVNYCDKTAGQFRSDLLAPFITSYLDEPETPELIHSYVGKLIMSLIKSVEEFPSEYREVLTIINSKVNELPSQFKHYSISSFLFLRFLCPAIVVPSKYGVGVGQGVGERVKERKRLVGLATVVQQVVSQFTEGQERSPFSFEMGVLYSKITKSFAVSLEMDEIQRSIKKLVSHHDLLTVKSTFEKNQRECEKAGKMGVERLLSFESSDETLS